jgi:hypothetical protein
MDDLDETLLLLNTGVVKRFAGRALEQELVAVFVLFPAFPRDVIRVAFV